MATNGNNTTSSALYYITRENHRCFTKATHETPQDTSQLKGTFQYITQLHLQLLLQVVLVAV
jgi:hypothetical protein